MDKKSEISIGESCMSADLLRADAQGGIAPSNGNSNDHARLDDRASGAHGTLRLLAASFSRSIIRRGGGEMQ